MRPRETQGDSTGRRLALARWLTDRKHPLTARVIVNRVWGHHFGVGIVATPGNFGRSGSPPSHPHLLDWLAVDFMEHGWSIKRLHRQIMCSAVYRQASHRRVVNQQSARSIDPKNRLLWRMKLRRLESEIIRDSVLVVSGELDRTFGGPPVMLTKPSNGLSMVQRGAPGSHLRRSVYLLARRVYPLKFLEVFDSPIMAINCTPRPSRARAVIQLFQNGGPSQMDLFDPKPELTRRNGQPHPGKVETFQLGNKNILLKSPFRFHRRGECGMELGETIPQLGSLADELCLVRSMYTENNNHPFAINMMQTGKTFAGRPAMGSWICYALGSESRNLPGYIVLRDPGGYNTSGKMVWSSGWLPAVYQGTEFNTRGTPVHHLHPARKIPAKAAQRRLGLLAELIPTASETASG